MTNNKKNVVSPEENERVHEILTRLMKGEEREDIAKSLGQKTYKSLDMYMRRKGYRYDSRIKNYVVNVEPSESISDGSKTSKIVKLLEEYADDPAMVCLKVGFKNMEELAAYMTSKSYKWNPSLQNYEKQSNHVSLEENVMDHPQESTVTTNHHQLSSEYEDYLPLLRMLQKNEDRLIELLMPYGRGATIPRYTIKGIAKTKTVQMIHTLGDLVTEFSMEKNVPQRDIFEVALIDFFRKYGFEKEIERVLNK